ncbi:MAG: ribokinase [Saprospiraceae bacterium]
MKILNFGSINIDYVYSLSHFVQPGETISSKSFQTFIGGKGCNQSVAIAKSGVEVFHAGNISESGLFIKKQLDDWNVNTQFINIVKEATGHAIIQVNDEGENSIIIHGGANQTISEIQIDETLAHFEKGDFLILQNEINNIDSIIAKAKEKEMQIFFNPAPMTNDVHNYPLELVDFFIVNETEGQQLTGETNVKSVINKMKSTYPNAAIIMTLGEKGVIYVKNEEWIEKPTFEVEVVDTTAAGDTFIGYFVASLKRGKLVESALQIANRAASLTVTQKGGAISIPTIMP